MIEALAAKVWGNPRFQDLAFEVDAAWLSKELKLPGATRPDSSKLLRLMQSAAILSCSEQIEHRIAAYKTATTAYDLQGGGKPWDEMMRVVFARIGNFPAMLTRSAIADASSGLPLRLATEEVAAVEAHTISVSGATAILTDFQRSLWERLQVHERLALSAPTSAGKSFVLQSFLSTLFDGRQPLQAVYLVPTRALIAQVSADLIERFLVQGGQAPEIVTMPPEEGTALANRAINVLTQERCQLLLQAHEKFSTDLIIVDEAHSIADGSRGILLQWVIDDLLARRPGAQILFASPVVRNLDVFGRLFGLDDVRPVKSTEPTVSQNFIYVDVLTAKKGLVQFSRMRAGEALPHVLGQKQLGQTLASRKDRIVHIALSMEGNGASLVYANGAAEAEEFALQLADQLGSREQMPAREEIAELAREVVHDKFVLSSCISKGVGFHYSNIPTVLRMAIEEGFKAGHIDYLACTSTLLQGVNLPAKHIFMSAPEKGRRNPLGGADFWNLSGRAGRLRHEFQGNIFLIDYKKWKSQPLGEDRDVQIRPAIESTLTESHADLLSVIRQQPPSDRSKQDELESSFVRLFSDYREGHLLQTFVKAGIASTSASIPQTFNALEEAAKAITLPSRILKRSGDVSAYKQQKLYDNLFKAAGESREAALRLIPAHPRESGAYSSHAMILALCYEILLGIDPARNLHKFHAMMALRWMNGWSLPRIIQAQIDYKPGSNIRKVIRETLELIETQVRFHVARMFGCYANLLVYALDQAGHGDLVESIPGLPLFLEVGASDQTMISFMAMGLSRATSTRLNELASNKNMDVAAARQWLARQPLDNLGVSPLLRREIGQALSTRNDQSAS